MTASSKTDTGTAHTPGPWTVTKSASHNGYTVWGTPDWDGERRDVASVFMAYGLKAEERREIVSANARLIAAAPDMLEALITALPYIECAEEDEAYKPGVVAKVTAQVRSAIALATQVQS